MLNGGLREVWALAATLGLKADSDVLELGCGLGGPMRFIAERYHCHVTGVDVTPRQVETARSLTAGLDVEPLLEFVLADACALAFAGGRFTHVYSLEALVHVSDKVAAISEAFRVLEPGGIFCVHDPVVAVPSFEIALFHEAVFPLPLRDYMTALDDAGFRDVVVIDRTRESVEGYALLGQLAARGPISPSNLLAVFDRRYPGVRPPLLRLLSPARVRHVLRYALARSAAAGDLFGDPELVRGVHQMCEDIIAGYASGAQALYQIRARKP